MKNRTSIKIALNLFIISAFLSCGTNEKPEATVKVEPSVNQEIDTVSLNLTPKEMLREAYQLFKEGNDEASIELANKVLAIGKETNNDTLIGGALSSLCRNAQRTLDTTKLRELSVQLAELSEQSGDQQWMMKRAHMNAEMWRLIGNLDKAEAFYNESMETVSYTHLTLPTTSRV